jgi:hypothetical protein
MFDQVLDAAVTTRDLATARRCVSARDHGRDKSLDQLSHPIIIEIRRSYVGKLLQKGILLLEARLCLLGHFPKS